MATPDSKQARSVCPLDCPDTCGLKVTVEEGKVTQVTGDPEHPVTQGAICHKVRQFPDRVHHPDRLLYPMRRTGPKGAGRFKRMSWEEALTEIVDRFRSTIHDYGAEAILPYSYYGNMGLVNNGSMDRRFFHRLGASRLKRTICNTAGNIGFAHTMGIKGAIDPEETVHSRYVLLWGGDFISTNMHQMMFLQQARKQGARIVTIDVRRTRTARWSDEFIQIYPGTDASLALAMMHVMVKENRIDWEFIRQYTTGWEPFRRRIELYSPERAAEETGVPAETIRRLARDYAAVSPSFIRIGNGLQHHDHGGMTVRTIACLPALTGQWRYRGGGALKENGFSTVDTLKLERPDLLPNPGVRSFNMIQLGDILLQANPPIRCLFVYNTNPAAVAPSQEKVIQGLKREDLFTVVHDLFITDTARYADLVLPATSSLENTDVYKSYWHLYFQMARPVLSPQGEAWSNFRLFQTLAERMGFDEPCFRDQPEDIIRQVLDNPANPWMEDLSFEELAEKGILKVNPAKDPLFPDRLSRPEGKIALYSEASASLGLDPLPGYRRPREGGSAAGPIDPDHPYILLSPPNHQFLNTSMANIPKLKRIERKPELEIHPDDAADRGIENGDTVEVFNHRGRSLLSARLTTDVPRGVVVAPGVWWNDAYKGRRGINQLTPDREADLGGGAVFFSTAVNLKRREYSKNAVT